MTDTSAIPGGTRRRRIAVALGAVALGAVAVFVGIGRENVAPDSAARHSAPLPAVAPDESNPGVRKATRRSATRIDTSAPLPEPGTRLAPVYAELKARADAGDAAAASRLYRDLHRCLHAAEVLRVDVLPEPEPDEVPDTASPEQRAKALAIREQYRANRVERLRKARQDLAMCEGLDSNQQLVLPALRRAAELGDKDAETCYVSGHDLLKQGILDHPEWMAEYKENVLAIADAAVERGNMGVVRMLASVYSSDSTPGWLPSLERLTGRDPVRSYRYHKLSSLALEDRGASDAGLAAAALTLPAQERAAADAWAQDMYARRFAHSVRRMDALCYPDINDEINTQ